MPTELVDLSLAEVSGVDHPASLVEGWLVMKNADTETLDPTLNNDDVNPEPSTSPPVETETTMPTATETPAAADPVVVPDDTSALVKELTDIRKELADAKADRDALADTVATEKALATVTGWGRVPGMTPAFADTLKTLDPDTATAVAAIFDTVQAAFPEADVMKEYGTTATAPGGTTATPGRDQIQAIAKGLVADGTAPNMLEGLKQAAMANVGIATEGN